MDKSSLAHCCYVCTYHIVFIPKCRRKIMYGAVKKDVVEIIKKLIEMKGVELIEGKVCKDPLGVDKQPAPGGGIIKPPFEMVVRNLTHNEKFSILYPIYNHILLT